MKALVKIGGSLLDDPASRQQIARQLAHVSATGVALTVVHGGGKQMTRFLEERGIKSTFVRGLRVTNGPGYGALLVRIGVRNARALVFPTPNGAIMDQRPLGIEANLIIRHDICSLAWRLMRHNT